MRLNVYTEELLKDEGPNGPVTAEIVSVEYISSRTGEAMKNYGLRIYFKSHPDLHYIPPRDDDRSAVTFWCGSKRANVRDFWEQVRNAVQYSDGLLWREKMEEAQREAEAQLGK